VLLQVFRFVLKYKVNCNSAVRLLQWGKPATKYKASGLYNGGYSSSNHGPPLIRIPSIRSEKHGGVPARGSLGPKNQSGAVTVLRPACGLKLSLRPQAHVLHVEVVPSMKSEEENVAAEEPTLSSLSYAQH